MQERSRPRPPLLQSGSDYGGSCEHYGVVSVAGDCGASVLISSPLIRSEPLLPGTPKGCPFTNPWGHIGTS